MSKTETLGPDVRQKMTANRVVSSDSHMTEPPRLWEERIDKPYRDRAPKYIFDEKKSTWMFFIDGQTPRNVNVSMAVGQKPEDYKEFFKKGIDSARPGGWDPAERIKDMATDGVYASVLLPAAASICSESKTPVIRRLVSGPTMSGSRSSARTTPNIWSALE